MYSSRSENNNNNLIETKKRAVKAITTLNIKKQKDMQSKEKELKNKSIFIDLEWRTGKNPKIFLLGWAKTITKSGFLYGKKLNAKDILHLLADVKYIYVFGPDIGWMENKYNLKLKENYHCINLSKAFKRLKPRLKNHTLANIEKHYKIKRTTTALKSERNNLYNTWIKDPQKVLDYNLEDSVNLIKVFVELKKEKKLTIKDFDEYRLLP